jgi:hypothetical protein
MWLVALSSLRARVALGVRAPDGGHVGVLYQPAPLPGRVPGEWSFLHLAWHHRLLDDPVPGPIAPHPVVAVDALEQHPELSDYVIAYCDRVARERTCGGLPYGFGWAPDLISDEPVVLQVATAGFTCATFALALLRRFVTLDYTTWRDEPEDLEWKDAIVTALRARRADEEHIRAVLRWRDAPRVRPTHVAAAATCEESPVWFSWAAVRAGEILAELRAPSDGAE